MTSLREPEEIRNAVRERYARIAAEAGNAAGGRALGCGCGCGEPSPRLHKMADYGPQAASVAAGADLGLGCGVPTRHVSLRPGEIVLDLGSGPGLDAMLAGAEVGSGGGVIGVDMTPDMVDLARRNAAEEGCTNVEFRLGEIEHLPVSDAEVDVVISNCVINLVPDKRAAFAEIARVLKPGGRFSISDMVYYGSMPEEVREDMGAWTGCIAGTVDRDRYLEMVRGAGLKEVTIVEERPVAPFDGPDWGIVSATITGSR